MDGVFLKWSRTFVEFCEFRETDKSLKHELGFNLLHVSYWHCGSMLVSYRRAGWVAFSSPFNVIYFLSMNSPNSVKNIYEKLHCSQYEFHGSLFHARLAVLYE